MAGTPSFSSFKPPVFSSFPDLGDRKTDNTEEHRKSDRKSKDKKRKSKHKSDEHDAPKHDSKHSGKDVSRVIDLLEEDKGSLNKGYYVDRKGDPLNITYGGLHAGDIPKHRLVDRSRILGLDARWRAYYRSGRTIQVGVGSKHRTPALTDSSSRALIALPPTHSFPVQSQQLGQDAPTFPETTEDGFLSLSTVKRSGRHNNEPSSSRSRDEPVWASRSPNSDYSSSEDATSSDESDGEEDTPISLTAHQATLKTLEERVQASPFSVDTWLELVDRTVSTIPTTSKNADKATAEITTSILSKALSAHDDNRHSHSLHIRYLRSGEQIWDEDACRAEWEKALKVLSSNTGPDRASGITSMWLHWLSWRLRSSGKGINGALQDLDRIRRAFSDSLKSEDLEMAQLLLLWRTAVLLQAAGLIERATAMILAQVELSFKCPPELQDSTLADQLDALEEFWESEAPRVGEEQYVGWASWLSADGESSPVAATNPPVTQIQAGLEDRLSAWHRAERHLDQIYKLPSRSTDPESDEDPFATVLFSDIRPFLTQFHSSNAKRVFKLVCLDILGLRVPNLVSAFSGVVDDGEFESWTTQTLTGDAYIRSVLPAADTRVRIQSDAHAGVTVGRQKEYRSSCFGPVKNWSWNLLPPLTLCHAHDKKTWVWDQQDVGGIIGVDVVRRFFSQMRDNGDEEWDDFALEFEAQVDVKRAIKLSKSFLADSRQSLRRWAAHARLERLRGKMADARKVYQTALASSPPDAPFRSQLCFDWAEMEWLSGNAEEALRVILLSVELNGDSLGGIVLLRARSKLDDYASGSHSERWIELRALLELLSSNRVPDALAVYDKYRHMHTTGQIGHERLTVQSLQMIFQHSKVLKHPMPPDILRNRASEALEQYPENSIVFGLFLEGEKGQGVWGKVANALGDNLTRQHKSVARRAQEVWAAGWEIGAWNREMERTRRGLDAAVSNDRTKESALMWRLYIEFEIQNGQMQRAKSLFYRAVHECPIHKELYLLALGPLRAAFSQRELQSIADTMAERGIRTRRSLEDVTSGYEDGKEGYGFRVDEGEDEIEFNADELRRLKPY